MSRLRGTQPPDTQKRTGAALAIPKLDLIGCRTPHPCCSLGWGPEAERSMTEPAVATQRLLFSAASLGQAWRQTPGRACYGPFTFEPGAPAGLVARPEPQEVPAASATQDMESGTSKAKTCTSGLTPILRCWQWALPASHMDRNRGGEVRSIPANPQNKSLDDWQNQATRGKEGRRSIEGSGEIKGSRLTDVEEHKQARLPRLLGKGPSGKEEDGGDRTPPFLRPLADSKTYKGDGRRRQTPGGAGGV